MKQFFVTKSGLEIYDLCRAYGLALVLDKLKNLKNSDEEVVIKDVGFYYLIESPEINNVKDKKFIKSLIPERIPQGEERRTIEARWDQVLRTYKVKGDIEKKKKLSSFKEILKNNLEQIINNYSNLNLQISEKNTETLYGTIDPIAFKGVREVKKGVRYNEGGPYKVKESDLVLSAIGSAWIEIWITGREGIIGILGKPGIKGIGISEIRNIKKIVIDQINFHGGGVLPTIVWCAVSLLYTIINFKEEKIFGMFDGLYFNSLKWTGNQPKPEKGGKFSLEFLNKLAEKLSRDDLLMLTNIWMNIFKISSRGGLENLGISLAEFISNPSLSKFENYIKIHLHLKLNQKVGILYNEKLIKEITKYVKAV